MGWFGRPREQTPPHPRKEPRIDLPLTEENLKRVFADAADFSSRTVALGGNPERQVTFTIWWAWCAPSG